MIGLWDTTGNAVVKALATERRNAGGVTSGLVLTLIAVVDEQRIRAAEAAATIAAAAHPCRLLLVVRSDVTDENSRLDAEVVVGGRLGPCEAVVMRTRGRLALHAESVVAPLLAPDVPVVTWWQCAPPRRIAHDPLGVLAERRITDCARAADPLAALLDRAEDYAPGDTDLAWARLTPWRTLITSMFDATGAEVTEATVAGPHGNASAALLRGWLAARLGITPQITFSKTDRLEAVRLKLSDGGAVELSRDNGVALLRRSGFPDRTLPLARRPLGEALAEELRHLDADEPYAAALSAATGVPGLSERPPTRVHVWHDPALAEDPDKADVPCHRAGADDTSHDDTSPNGGRDGEEPGVTAKNTMVR